MRQYFKNKVLDEQFKKDGIIKVSLLNSEEVNELLALYKTIKRPLAFKELHFNIRTDSVAEKLRVQEKLLSILQQRVTDMFTNVHLFGSCFITKGFGLCGVLQPARLYSLARPFLYSLSVPICGRLSAQSP